MKCRVNVKPLILNYSYKKAPNKILHELGERVKELTALHETARIIQNTNLSNSIVIKKILPILVEAWQYPNITAAKIKFDKDMFFTSNFIETPWKQVAHFITKNGKRGWIKICYLKKTPQNEEGPFLKEERSLIDSLSVILCSYFERKSAEEELKRINGGLEKLVKARSAKLEEVNKKLLAEIIERKNSEEKLKQYQQQLRELASQLTLTEERERFEIASDLHDHIGQALAMIRFKLAEIKGNVIFCGYEKDLDHISSLLDQTIQYTRNLTFAISPPILHELGLKSAIEWLLEDVAKKHKLRTNLIADKKFPPIEKEIQVMLFKAVKELLVNITKHSQASNIIVKMKSHEDNILIDVDDNGKGFDISQINIQNKGFGLFSIKERLQFMGGHLTITSAPGKGTTVSLVSLLKLEKRKN